MRLLVSSLIMLCLLACCLVGSVRAVTVEVSYILESPHPYPNDYDHVWTITQPGAESIRLHFVNYSVEPGFDFIYILDGEDNIVTTYTGDESDVWTPWVSGDTIKVRLTSDSSVKYYGFYVDKYQYNTSALPASEFSKVGLFALVAVLGVVLAVTTLRRG